jgi:hypothetical protein
MYALLVGSFVALLLTGWLGLRGPGVEHGVSRHWQVALWTVLLVLMAHTLVMFYFLATGKQLKVVMQSSGREVNRQHMADLRLIKNKVFPWIMAALFSTIATFVVGGGVLVGAVPRLVHLVLAIIAAISNLVGVVLEIQYIGRNSRIIQAIERDYLDA